MPIEKGRFEGPPGLPSSQLVTSQVSPYSKPRRPEFWPSGIQGLGLVMGPPVAAASPFYPLEGQWRPSGGHAIPDRATHIALTVRLVLLGFTRHTTEFLSRPPFYTARARKAGDSPTYPGSGRAGVQTRLGWGPPLSPASGCRPPPRPSSPSASSSVSPIHRSAEEWSEVVLTAETTGRSCWVGVTVTFQRSGQDG